MTCIKSDNFKLCYLLVSTKTRSRRTKMECKGTKSSSSTALSERLAVASEFMFVVTSGRSLSSRLRWLRFSSVLFCPGLLLRRVKGERQVQPRRFRYLPICRRGAIVGRHPENTSIAGSTTVQLLSEVFPVYPVRISGMMGWFGCWRLTCRIGEVLVEKDHEAYQSNDDRTADSWVRRPCGIRTCADIHLQSTKKKNGHHTDFPTFRHLKPQYSRHGQSQDNGVQSRIATLRYLYHSQHIDAMTRYVSIPEPLNRCTLKSQYQIACQEPYHYQNAHSIYPSV